MAEPLEIAVSRRTVGARIVFQPADPAANVSDELGIILLVTTPPDFIYGFEDGEQTVESIAGDALLHGLRWGGAFVWAGRSNGERPKRHRQRDHL